MRAMFRIWIFTISLFLLSMLGGCVGYMKFTRYVDTDTYGNPSGSNPLAQSPCPLVKYPAAAGFWAGAIIGIPAEIPYFIVMVSLNEFCGVPLYSGDDPCYNSENDMGMILFAPMIMTGAVGEVALGLPCWVLFGWWWPEAKATITPHSNKEKPL